MLSKPMVILISLLCVTSTSVFAEDDIKFTATPNDLTAINACHQNSTELYQKCSTCLKGMPTTGAFLNYSILVHALRKGGLDIPLVLFESPNSERNRLSITNGTATIKGDWDFNIDGNTDVYKSDPFIL